MRQTLIILTILLGLPRAYPCGFHEVYNKNLIWDDKQFPEEGTTYDPNNPAHRGWSQYLAKSLHKQRKIVLTYDDGPHPTNTPRLLDILKKYNVKATFFTVGELVRKYPKIAQRIADEGHILAGHDWQHTNSNTEDRDEYALGLGRTVLAVKDHYKKREMYYRFPYGAYGRPNSTLKPYHHFNVMKEVSNYYFADNCINFAFWDIDTSDWVENMTSDDIVQTLEANFEGGQAWMFKKATVNGRSTYIKAPFIIKNPLQGGVILMHDIHARTVEATEKFLNKIQGTSIEITPLNEVEEFEYANKVCEMLRLF